MANSRWQLSGRLQALAISGLFAASAMLAGGIGSDDLLRNSFQSAIADDHAAQTPVVASKVPVSGSEAYWLSPDRTSERHRKNIQPAMRKVAVGDRISLTLAGESRTYEVATVEEAGPQLTRIDISTSVPRVVVITAKDTADVATGDVRFIVEYNGARATSLRNISGRAL